MIKPKAYHLVFWSFFFQETLLKTSALDDFSVFSPLLETTLPAQKSQLSYVLLVPSSLSLQPHSPPLENLIIKKIKSNIIPSLLIHHLLSMHVSGLFESKPLHQSTLKSLQVLTSTLVNRGRQINIYACLPPLSGKTSFPHKSGCQKSEIQDVIRVMVILGLLSLAC